MAAQKCFDDCNLTMLCAQERVRAYGEKPGKCVTTTTVSHV